MIIQYLRKKSEPIEYRKIPLFGTVDCILLDLNYYDYVEDANSFFLVNLT